MNLTLKISSTIRYLVIACSFAIWQSWLRTNIDGMQCFIIPPPLPPSPPFVSLDFIPSLSLKTLHSCLSILKTPPEPATGSLPLRGWSDRSFETQSLSLKTLHSCLSISFFSILISPSLSLNCILPNLKNYYCFLIPLFIS